MYSFTITKGNKDTIILLNVSDTVRWTVQSRNISRSFLNWKVS